MQEVIPDWSGLSATLLRLAELEESAGNGAAVMDYLDRSLELARRHGIVRDEYAGSVIKAESYERQGRNDEARVAAEHALTVSRAFGGAFDLRPLLLLGKLAGSRAWTRRAHLNEALHVAVAQRDVRGDLAASEALGDLEVETARWKMAGECYGRMLRAAEYVGDAAAIGRAQAGLGQVYLELGSFSQASSVLALARRYFATVGDPDWVQWIDERLSSIPREV